MMPVYKRLQELLSNGTVILCVVAMGVLLLGMTGLWVVQQELIVRAGESLALGATEVAAKLDAQVVERMGDLEVLATAPQLHTTDVSMARAHLATVQHAYPAYARLVLANRAGRVVASTDHALLGRDVRDASWFQAVRDVPRPHAEPVVGREGESSRLAAVAFSAPIKGTDGTFQGVIMTEVDRGYWQKVASETVDQFGVQSKHFGLVRYRVLDQEGEVLLTLERGEPRGGNLQRLGLPSAMRVAAGRPGWIEEEHFMRKVPVITGYARMRGVWDSEALQWGILLRADRQDVLQHIQGVLFKLALTGGAAFMPLVGLVFWTNLRQRRAKDTSAQAQRALAESESRMRTILDSAMDAVIVMNTQGLIIGWNKQAEKVLGWPAQEVLGQSLVTRIVPAQYRDAHNQGLARYLGTGSGAILNQRVEVTAVRKDGVEFPVELTVTPVHVKGGVIFSAFLRDITERTRTERQMRVQYVVTKTLNGESAMEQMPAALLEAIGMSLHWAVGVWWEPESGTDHLRSRAVWASEAAPCADFLKATHRIRFQAGTGLPGRVWESGQPTWVPDVMVDANFPRVSAAAVAGLHGALAIPVFVGGHVVAVLEFFATTVQVPDGTLLDVMKWIGSQIGAYLEKRQAEQARRDSDARMRAVVIGALDAIVLMDGEGRIAGWNRRAEEIFGWLEAEALGRDLSETIVPSSLREAHRAGLAAYRATGVGALLNQMIEITAVRKDGSEFPVELTITPLQVESGMMFSAFVRDITVRKQMVERLNERETFFRLLSEQLPIGVFEVNAAGACVYTNTMWGAIVQDHGDPAGGQPKTDGSSEPWTQWFHEEDRTSLEQAWAETTSSFQPIRQECRLVGDQEQVQWVQVLLWPMVTETGVRYLGTIEDITVRKRTIAHTMQLLRQGHFDLQTLSEAKNLAELLAYAFPDPARAQLGLTELLVNGVEHGNLELSYDEKSRLLEQGKFDGELARRLALPDYARRRVRLAMERTGAELRLRIVDEGKGFDWRPYLDLEGEVSDKSHGRGIAMSKAIGFDRLEYRGCGNEVVVLTRLDGTKVIASPDERKAA